MADYYLVQLEKETDENEFDKFVSVLHKYKGVGIDRLQDSNEVRIFYGNSELSAILKLTEDDYQPTGKNLVLPDKKIVVESERMDNITINLLRSVSIEHGFRVFSKRLGVLLPKQTSLLDVYSESVRSDVTKVIEERGFELIFIFQEGLTGYAIKKGASEIHILNGDLINYLSLNPIKLNSREFSYKVAGNLEEFVTKYDAGLIPRDFYKYYEKPFKIINHSSFDIKNIYRKVFVKPYIFELNNQKQGFYTITNKDATALSMTKILKGETLDDTIKRFLSKNLKIADNYIGAVVHRNLEFDIDKRNKLIPRLIITIYIDQESLSEEQKIKFTRGWVSIEKD